MKIKNFFSNVYVQIGVVFLLLAIVAGAAALLLPTAQNAADSSDCLHGRYRYNGTGTNDDGSTVYSFICVDCRAVIRETPAVSSFVLNKPTLEDGAVIMNAPWEIGAYYTTNGVTTYKPFTAKSGDWYTDGVLWTTSTGIRVEDYRVNMIAVDYGAGAISYVAEKDCYVRPYFQKLTYVTDSGYGEFVILVNGERVLPESKDIVAEAASGGTDITDSANATLADQWIHLKKGDRLNFVIYGTGATGYEFTVHPAVEIMTYLPTRE